MNVYQRYLKAKALADFYESLPDEDKQILANSYKNSKNLREVTTHMDCRDPYWRGVSQNIVGDALYDIGIHVLRKLLSRI